MKRSLIAQGKHIIKLCLFDNDVDEDFQELLEYAGKADSRDIEELCFTITIWVDEQDPLLQDLIPGATLLVSKISRTSMYKESFVQAISGIKNIKLIK